jgi:DoxX-like family
MDSTLPNTALVAADSTPVKTAPTAKATTTVFWIVTALFCLQMSFTACAELRLPQVAEAFAHLGFPAYFRVELSWAKLLGVVLLLAPVPARLKEWAYAGFAIDLASALIARFAVGDGPEAWGWAAGTAVLWALSYFFWRRLQPTPASIGRAPNPEFTRHGRLPAVQTAIEPKEAPLAALAGYAERG